MAFMCRGGTGRVLYEAPLQCTFYSTERKKLSVLKNPCTILVGRFLKIFSHANTIAAGKFPAVFYPRKIREYFFPEFF
jgi:hypothetical protein